jgi:hypothetical protein
MRILGEGEKEIAQVRGGGREGPILSSPSKEGKKYPKAKHHNLKLRKESGIGIGIVNIHRLL